jgi:glycosyltransferase involved in cell wall biosynthesis
VKGNILSVAVIVPCRNEAGEIVPLLTAILKHIKPTDQLIVVEGGSYDPTWEIVSDFAQKNPKVLAIQQSGKGKFDAVLTGISCATHDYVMVWDADGTVSFQDNLRIYNFDQKKDYLITGDRLLGEREPHAMQFFNLVGNYVFAVWWGLLLKRAPLDSLCGTKKFPRDLLSESPNWLIQKDPYGDFTMIGTAMMQGLSIESFSVDYAARRYGKTNIQRWSGGWSLLKLILLISIRKRKNGK